MGPKYVDRKVMKGSRAKLELSVATGIEMAAVGEGEEGGEKTEEEEQEREPETELEAGWLVAPTKANSFALADWLAAWLH